MQYRAWYMTKGGKLTWSVVEATDQYRAERAAHDKHGAKLRSVKPILPPPSVLPPVRR